MPNKKKADDTAATPVVEIKTDRNTENMAAAKLAHEAAITAYNAAFAATNVEEMRTAEEAVIKAEQDYAEAAECSIFAICKADEHPLLMAAKLHSYVVIKHKTTREDRIVTGIEMSEREKPIDLARLAKKCGLPTLWVNATESLNQLLTIRVAQEMGATTADLKKISKSYYMTKATDAIEVGKTPTSNNQLVKMLQAICNQILGEGVVSVNNHDIGYVIAAHTKKGRAKISVNTANHDFMRRLVLDVLHRCVTGAKYEVEFKQYAKAA